MSSASGRRYGTLVDVTSELGPQAVEVKAFLARSELLSRSEGDDMIDLWNASLHIGVGMDCRQVARDVGRDVAVKNVLSEAGYGEWEPVQHAAEALAVWDLIGDVFTVDQYLALTLSWRAVVGPIHPDDQVWSPEMVAVLRRLLPGWTGSMLELVETARLLG